MNIPLINGKAHDWASIEFMIMNTPFAGITAIKYDEKRAKKDNYGTGDRPVSRGYGPREASCSITLWGEEVAAIESVAPNGNITDIPPFDIIVMYIPVGSTVVTRHVIKNFEFVSNGRDTKTGDTGIEVELEGITSHIVWK